MMIYVWYKFYLLLFFYYSSSHEMTNQRENDSGRASNWYWFVCLIAFVEFEEQNKYDEYIFVIRFTDVR